MTFWGVCHAIKMFVPYGYLPEDLVHMTFIDVSAFEWEVWKMSLTLSNCSVRVKSRRKFERQFFLWLSGQESNVRQIPARSYLPYSYLNFSSTFCQINCHGEKSRLLPLIYHPTSLSSYAPLSPILEKSMLFFLLPRKPGKTKDRRNMADRNAWDKSWVATN